MNADDVIAKLGLQAHPEGGWFKETYRHLREDGGRGALTSIHYLLKAGEKSHWHRVTDADEVWNFHAGSPLVLRVADTDGTVAVHRLGADLEAGCVPQAVVPAGYWQAAETEGGWALVGCTVAPAFEFSSFEMAPPNWTPGASLD